VGALDIFSKRLMSMMNCGPAVLCAIDLPSNRVNEQDSCEASLIPGASLGALRRTVD
jgi:hypothetical protein